LQFSHDLRLSSFLYPLRPIIKAARTCLLVMIQCPAWCSDIAISPTKCFLYFHILLRIHSLVLFMYHLYIYGNFTHFWSRFRTNFYRIFFLIHCDWVEGQTLFYIYKLLFGGGSHGFTFWVLASKGCALLLLRFAAFASLQVLQILQVSLKLFH
jgi:hypothetical protein